jgi:hypothetical protein
MILKLLAGSESSAPLAIMPRSYAELSWSYIMREVCRRLAYRRYYALQSSRASRRRQALALTIPMWTFVTHEVYLSASGEAQSARSLISRRRADASEAQIEIAGLHKNSWVSS